MAAQAEDLTEEESALLLEDSVCTRLAALGDFLYDADSVGNLDLDAMAREDEEVRERTALALTQREESRAELSQILSSGAGSGENDVGSWCVAQARRFDDMMRAAELEAEREFQAQEAAEPLGVGAAGAADDLDEITGSGSVGAVGPSGAGGFFITEGAGGGEGGGGEGPASHEAEPTAGQPTEAGVQRGEEDGSSGGEAEVAREVIVAQERRGLIAQLEARDAQRREMVSSLLGMPQAPKAHPEGSAVQDGSDSGAAATNSVRGAGAPSLLDPGQTAVVSDGGRALLSRQQGRLASTGPAVGVAAMRPQRQTTARALGQPPAAAAGDGLGGQSGRCRTPPSSSACEPALFGSCPGCGSLSTRSDGMRSHPILSSRQPSVAPPLDETRRGGPGGGGGGGGSLGGRAGSCGVLGCGVLGCGRPGEWCSSASLPMAPTAGAPTMHRRPGSGGARLGGGAAFGERPCSGSSRPVAGRPVSGGARSGGAYGGGAYGGGACGGGACGGGACGSAEQFHPLRHQPSEREMASQKMAADISSSRKVIQHGSTGARVGSAGLRASRATTR